MILTCDKCGHQIGIDNIGEEVLNPNVFVVRRHTERSSWDYIANEIRNGTAYRAVSVGDEIPFRLTDGEEVSVVSVHENPYWKNSMAFVLKDCLKDPHNMNDRNTNAGGYAATKMWEYLTTNVFRRLPTELATLIKPRQIEQRFANGSVYKVESLIWNPSYIEVVANPDEDSSLYLMDFGDVHFDYFSDAKSRVKNLGASANGWWLRSAYNGSSFCGVNNAGGGSDDYSNANGANGVVFGFII